MKLVFQIAGGIVIGVFVILFLLGLGVEYQAQQAVKEIAEMQKQRKIKNAKTQENMRRKLESDRKRKAPVSNLQWTTQKPSTDKMEKNTEIINQLIKKGY